MVMKDKLEKNHHKAGYYRMKRFCVASVFGASLAASIIVPTYINKNQKAVNVTKAEETVVENNEEVETNEINKNELLHY